MMDVFTLYVAQGALSAVRSQSEAVIIDAHMPDCKEVTRDSIERSLTEYLKGRRVRGLILTGLDSDHAHPAGVELILKKWTPDWVMYPTVYKDTDCAGEVFASIDKEVTRRKNTQRPLRKESVRVDKLDSRHLPNLADDFEFELFSPHVEDMDCSNNSSIVVAIEGRYEAGFRYLVTGDTEQERWERIAHLFGASLASDVMAAPHHGSKSGVHPKSLLLTKPHTVLISAGVDNQYGHPDPQAVRAYSAVATAVWATNGDPDGACLFTRRVPGGFETRLLAHS